MDIFGVQGEAVDCCIVGGWYLVRVCVFYLVDEERADHIGWVVLGVVFFDTGT